MHDAPRTNVAGGCYHVTNRGNRKAVIFPDNRCRRRFIRILIESLQIYGVTLLGGCLIPNHFHLAIVTPRANVSDFMRDLESRYADYWNWRFGQVGHLFQGPFRDTLIEHDLHLFTTVAYIFLNPVRAGIARRAEDYCWSTYAATIGVAARPNYLCLDWLEVLYPAPTRQASQARLAEVMHEDRPVAAYLLQNELGISDDPPSRRPARSFVLAQLQAARSHPPPPSLAELRSLLPDPRRFIHDARVICGYKVAEIARALNMPRPSVSKIFWQVYRGNRPER